jgi:hypothetical protein
MLDRRRCFVAQDILAYVATGLSNGRVEGTNGTVRVITLFTPAPRARACLCEVTPTHLF